MDELDIDYEGTSTQGTNSVSATTSTTNENSSNVQEEVTNLNGGDKDDITGKDGKSTETKEQQEDTNLSTGELNIGDNLEIDGTIYTVANNGDLVDEKGNVFKEAKDVSNWLKSVELSDDDSESPLSITSIQETLGVTITDENGNDVEFTNDAEGVKSYVDAVINVKSQELQEAAINRLYADNPLLKQFQDYVLLNGTARGFGELPDRSGVIVERDNEQQQVAIIQMAAKEFGNRTLNANYIKYLKDSGSLYEEACAQLSALVEKDEAYKKEIAQQAKAARDKEHEELTAYWDKVNNTINNRIVAGYRIPDTFTKEIDGKKVVMTPNDFFNYVSSPIKSDSQNRTAYQRDLANLSDEAYLNREILDAWLMFTGGTYKDLIDMAVKEDKVRQLKAKAKEQRAIKSVKVIKKSQGKTSIDDIIL